MDAVGNTALTLAAQHESWETVAYLVGKGADTDEGPEVEAPDGSGPQRVACIIAAAWHGRWDVVVSLVNAGVDGSTTDPYGRTPAVLAAQVSTATSRLRAMAVWLDHTVGFWAQQGCCLQRAGHLRLQALV